MKDPHKYDILYQEICSDNIQRISELIALIETKKLINFFGYPMLVLHKRLCNDVDFKTNIEHQFSDGYDIVQTVALLLCEHYGEHLDNTCYINKRGKRITVRILCNRAVGKIVNRKMRNGREKSIEAMPIYKQPRTETIDVEKDYAEADRIVASLDLDETMTTALECRMSGMSYPEIGRIIGRSQSTVWEYCRIIKQKYTAVYGTI